MMIIWGGAGVLVMIVGDDACGVSEEGEGALWGGGNTCGENIRPGDECCLCRGCGPGGNGNEKQARRSRSGDCVLRKSRSGRNSPRALAHQPFLLFFRHATTGGRPAGQRVASGLAWKGGGSIALGRSSPSHIDP
jgi:hypothetical protein